MVKKAINRTLDEKEILVAVGLVILQVKKLAKKVKGSDDPEKTLEKMRDATREVFRFLKREKTFENADFSFICLMMKRLQKAGKSAVRKKDQQKVDEVYRLASDVLREMVRGGLLTKEEVMAVYRRFMAGSMYPSVREMEFSYVISDVFERVHEAQAA